MINFNDLYCLTVLPSPIKGLHPVRNLITIFTVMAQDQNRNRTMHLNLSTTFIWYDRVQGWGLNTHDRGKHRAGGRLPPFAGLVFRKLTCQTCHILDHDIVITRAAFYSSVRDQAVLYCALSDRGRPPRRRPGSRSSGYRPRGEQELRRSDARRRGIRAQAVGEKPAAPRTITPFAVMARGQAEGMPDCRRGERCDDGDRFSRAGRARHRLLAVSSHSMTSTPTTEH